jgi:hypothetical protein
MARQERPRSPEELERHPLKIKSAHREAASPDHENRYEDLSSDADAVVEEGLNNIESVVATDAEERENAAREKLGLSTNERGGADLERLLQATREIRDNIPGVRDRGFRFVLDGVSGSEYDVSNGSGLLGSRISGAEISRVLADPEAEKKYASTEEHLAAALTAGNEALNAYRNDRATAIGQPERRDLREMAAAAALIKIESGSDGNLEAVIGTVGDAPIYVLDGPPGQEVLRLISADESALAKAVEAGKATPEDVKAVLTKDRDSLTFRQQALRTQKGVVGNAMGKEGFTVKIGGSERLEDLPDVSEEKLAINRPNVRRITGLSKRAKILVATDGIEKIPPQELAELLRKGDHDEILKRGRESKKDDTTFSVIEVETPEEKKEAGAAVLGGGVESIRAGREFRLATTEIAATKARELSTIEGGIEFSLSDLVSDARYKDIKAAKKELLTALLEQRSYLANSIDRLEAEKERTAEEKAELKESKKALIKTLSNTERLTTELEDAARQEEVLGVEKFRGEIEARTREAPAAEKPQQVGFQEAETRALKLSGEAEQTKEAGLAERFANWIKKRRGPGKKPPTASPHT